MDSDDTDQRTAETAENTNAAKTAATPPRGNPETDHESVEKGKAQLDKVSGN
jgi:hypothetical protein